MTTTFVHDPAAVLDYAIDWSQWLQNGETITSATWADSVPAGLEQATGKPPSIDGATTVVWLTGGTAGTLYTVTAHVVTSMGREDDRTFAVRVQER